MSEPTIIYNHRREKFTSFHFRFTSKVKKIKVSIIAERDFTFTISELFAFANKLRLEGRPRGIITVWVYYENNTLEFISFDK